MALWEFSNKNKYGNWRTRIIFRPDNQSFSHGPDFGNGVSVKRFKYIHEHLYSPILYTSKEDGKKYILPTWKVVHPDTQQNDIVWVKPKINKVVEKEVWKFESSSEPGSFYFVKRSGDKLTCTCSGYWRSKDRRCKHVKEVEQKIK